MLLLRRRAPTKGELIRRGLLGGLLGVGLSALLCAGMLWMTAPPEPSAAVDLRWASTFAPRAWADDGPSVPGDRVRRRTVRLPGREKGASPLPDEIASAGGATTPTAGVPGGDGDSTAAPGAAGRESAHAAVASEGADAPGPAGVAGSRGEEAPTAASERPVNDPDLILLKQLGVDLDHPDAEMRRLANEYRAGLQALQNRLAGVDQARLVLLDRGMAALLRVKPAVVGTVYALFAEETDRAAGRYDALLLRGGDLAPLVPRLADMAYGDPDPWRRASAVIALGPVPGIDALPVVLNALLDPAVEVRSAAASVVSEAILVQPALKADPGVRASLQTALDAEQDPGVRAVLVQVVGRS